MSLKDKANERKARQKARNSKLHEEQRAYREYVLACSKQRKPALKKVHFIKQKHG